MGRAERRPACERLGTRIKRRPARAFVAITATLVLLGALVLVVVRIAANRIVFQEACTATAGGAKARVSIEQAENASIIASVAACSRSIQSLATKLGRAR
jgi:hypothetical protein